MDKVAFAKRLEKDIDRLLEGHSLPNNLNLEDDYRKDLDVARLLAQQDVSHESRIQKTLRENLITHISEKGAWDSNEKEKYHMNKPLKLFAYTGAIVAILVIIVTLPPVRVLAQDILNKVGPFNVIPQNLPQNPPTPAGFNPTPLPGSVTNQSSAVVDLTQNPGNGYASNEPTPVPPDPDVRIITAEEALEQFNFKALTPTYVPEGFTLINAPNNNIIFIGAEYISSSMAYTSVDGADLQIDQHTFNQQGQIPFNVGEVDVTQIKVRGKDAVFVKDAIMGVWVDANGKDIPVSYLMWEEDGFFFMMTASKLNQDEMVKIAESLK
ncbi:MAG: DUF4367 domain-containing protein [Anaerolineales bacterium]|nr:DUF4367 domain-containing protein [Anaerolineales bacterium]